MGHLKKPHSLTAGSGPPVVLLHGVGLQARSWDAQITALSNAHTVHALDLPGHGGSAPLEGAAPELRDFSRQIEQFLKDTIAAPVILAGHSLGALVALDIAARHPGLCRGVAALNAVFRRPPESRRGVAARAAQAHRHAHQSAAGEAPDGPDRQQAIAATLARWFGDPPAEQAQASAALSRHWLMQTDPAAYAAAYTVFAAEDGPADTALAALAMPALFLTGDGDPHSTPAMAQAMARCAPRGQAVIVKGGRHLCQLTHPEAVNAALMDFCRTSTADGHDSAPLSAASAAAAAAAGGRP